MQIAHQAFQALVEDVSVDLGRGNVGVPKQRLHHAQVGAVVQEVAGEGVAQHVRAHLRRSQSGGSGQCLELAGEVLAGEMAAAAE